MPIYEQAIFINFVIYMTKVIVEIFGWEGSGCIMVITMVLQE